MTARTQGSEWASGWGLWSADLLAQEWATAQIRATGWGPALLCLGAATRKKKNGMSFDFADGRDKILRFVPNPRRPARRMSSPAAPMESEQTHSQSSASARAPGRSFDGAEANIPARDAGEYLLRLGLAAASALAAGPVCRQPLGSAGTSRTEEMAASGHYSAGKEGRPSERLAEAARRLLLLLLLQIGGLLLARTADAARSASPARWGSVSGCSGCVSWVCSCPSPRRVGQERCGSAGWRGSNRKWGRRRKNLRGLKFWRALPPFLNGLSRAAAAMLRSAKVHGGQPVTDPSRQPRNSGAAAAQPAEAPPKQPPDGFQPTTIKMSNFPPLPGCALQLVRAAPGTDGRPPLHLPLPR